MGELLDSLKKYFKSTSKEDLIRDWQEIEHLNEIGPDVFEYAKYLNDQFGVAVPCLNLEKRCEIYRDERFTDLGINEVSTNARFFLAA